MSSSSPEPAQRHASSTDQNPTPSWRGQRTLPARPGAAGEVAPRLSPGSWTVVNSGGRGEKGGSELPSGAERRGRGREGGAINSPEKAKSPRRRRVRRTARPADGGLGMVGDEGAGPGAGAVQTSEAAGTPSPGRE